MNTVSDIGEKVYDSQSERPRGRVHDIVATNEFILLSIEHATLKTFAGFEPGPSRTIFCIHNLDFVTLKALYLIGLIQDMNKINIIII